MDKNNLNDLKFSVYYRVGTTTGREEDWNYITSHLLTTKDCRQIDAITRLRAENEAHGHSEKYKEIKRNNLNVWCPAGVLHREKGNSHIIQWSGLVQIDIDEQNNEGKDIGSVLACDLLESNWKNMILFLSRSSGGKGYYLLFRCPIQNEEDYNFYARALYFLIVVETGLIPDKKVLKSTYLRFLSIDETAFINTNAETFILPDEVRFCIAESNTDVSNNKAADNETDPTDFWPAGMPAVKINISHPGAYSRFKRTLKEIGLRRVDIAPSFEEYKKLVTSLKSAARSGVFDDYDGLKLLAYICEFWTNPHGENLEHREKFIRSCWKSFIGEVKPSGLRVYALNGFYTLCKNAGIKAAM